MPKTKVAGKLYTCNRNNKAHSHEKFKTQHLDRSIAGFKKHKRKDAFTIEATTLHF